MQKSGAQGMCRRSRRLPLCSGRFSVGERAQLPASTTELHQVCKLQDQPSIHFLTENNKGHTEVSLKAGTTDRNTRHKCCFKPGFFNAEKAELFSNCSSFP